MEIQEIKKGGLACKKNFCLPGNTYWPLFLSILSKQRTSLNFSALGIGVVRKFVVKRPVTAVIGDDSKPQGSSLSFSNPGPPPPGQSHVRMHFPKFPFFPSAFSHQPSNDNNNKYLFSLVFVLSTWLSLQF